MSILRLFGLGGRWSDCPTQSVLIFIGAIMNWTLGLVVNVIATQNWESDVVIAQLCGEKSIAALNTNIVVEQSLEE